MPSKPGTCLLGECSRTVPAAGGQVSRGEPPSLKHHHYNHYRLLLYPKSTHALSEVEVESDSFMNAVLWLHAHLGS